MRRKPSREEMFAMRLILERALETNYIGLEHQLAKVQEHIEWLEVRVRVLSSSINHRPLTDEKHLVKPGD
jgi:hypothetical protein